MPQWGEREVESISFDEVQDWVDSFDLAGRCRDIAVRADVFYRSVGGYADPRHVDVAVRWPHLLGKVTSGILKHLELSRQMSKRIRYASILLVSYHRHLLRNILDNNYCRSYLQWEI